MSGGVILARVSLIQSASCLQVDKITQAVKDLAEHAQGDIGLDYAYLDDVTYHDWQRYHDLIRSKSSTNVQRRDVSLMRFAGSENFTVHAQSIQDGTHPSPPINPVGPAIKELQDEVEDVIHGFNARLRTIKRSGARAFGTPEEEADEEQEGVDQKEITEPLTIGLIGQPNVGKSSVSS